MSSFEPLPPLPSTSNTREEGSARLAQLLDESDHKRCSDGNKNALLAESLDRLRSLTKDIQDDDWMFSSNNNNVGVGDAAQSSGGSGSGGGIIPAGDGGVSGTGMTGLRFIR